MASAAFTIRGANRIEPDLAHDAGRATSASDLPCPWCFAQTVESDTACPTCGQPFGQ